METVEVAGDTDSHVLSNLQADTEYIVTIIPLYEGNTEGPVATARFKIGRCGARDVSQSKTSLVAPCYVFLYLVLESVKS